MDRFIIARYAKRDAPNNSNTDELLDRMQVLVPRFGLQISCEIISSEQMIMSTNDNIDFATEILTEIRAQEQANICDPNALQETLQGSLQRLSDDAQYVEKILADLRASKTAQIELYDLLSTPAAQ